MRTRFTVEDAKGAWPLRAGPDRGVEGEVGGVRGKEASGEQREEEDVDHKEHIVPHLGFGRIVTSEIEAPNMLANLL